MMPTSFPWASAHSRVQPETATHLVRRADAAVAVFDVDRHRDRVLDSVTAPGAADAGLTVRNAIPIGVPDSKPASTSSLPDSGNCSTARAEGSMRCAPGDLGVKADFFATTPSTISFSGVISPPATRGTIE